MRRFLILALLLAGVVGVCAPLQANEARKAERAKKREARAAMQEIRKSTSRNLAIEGEELAANLEKVETLKWHDDTDAALKAATKADKPVFLLNVLGERCGFV